MKKKLVSLKFNLLLCQNDEIYIILNYIYIYFYKIPCCDARNKTIR